MAGRRTSRKRGPDPPDLADDLDPAPARLESGARWDCVRADGATAVDARVADISIRASVWSNADLAGRHFSGFACRDTRFDRCDLSGAVMDAAVLTRVTFTGCRMTGVVLAGATLQDVQVRECRADLANLRMARADFLLVEDSSLREAEFYSAVLARSALLDCDLQSANLEDCVLTDVDLHGSALGSIRGALSLRGATIGPEQILPLAPSLLAAAGVRVTDARRWGTRG